jgi:hypothetical protein
VSVVLVRGPLSLSSLLALAIARHGGVPLSTWRHYPLSVLAAPRLAPKICHMSALQHAKPCPCLHEPHPRHVACMSEHLFWLAAHTLTLVHQHVACGLSVSGDLNSCCTMLVAVKVFVGWCTILVTAGPNNHPPNATSAQANNTTSSRAIPYAETEYGPIFGFTDGEGGDLVEVCCLVLQATCAPALHCTRCMLAR